jgi:phosphoserine phosphatase
VANRFLTKKSKPAFKEVWAVGDNINDLHMLKLVDRPFVIEPKSPQLTQIKGVTTIESFRDLLVSAS